MLNTIIIEDEQHCADRLLKLISKHSDTFNVLAVCNTVKEAIITTDRLSPDLVFLDIKINDETGFDFLKKIEKINFEIIFTTAFENYAIKAIRFSAFDYLLKPIDEDDFEKTVKRLNEKFFQPNLNEQVKTLFHNLNSKEKSKKITIPTSKGLTFLDIIDILYCEADASYTHVFTKDQPKITVSKPLKYFENLLENNQFFRIHNSHLINLNHIKNYTKGKGGYVTMNNNVVIDVSTRRKSKFLKLFLDNY